MSEQLIQRPEASLDSIVLSASASELGGGAAAIILSILGLVHCAPTDMAAVSAMALGAAFALNGGLLGAERSRVMARTHPTTLEAAGFMSGVSVEAVAGVAALVLGILTLLRIDAGALMPVAALVLGIGMVFSSGALARLNSAALGKPEKPAVERVTYSVAAFAIASHILVGVGGIVLSILALIGFTPLLLSLVALVGLGSASMVTGASMTSRMLGTSSAA